MKLTFDIDQVRRCVEHARDAPNSAALYGEDLGRGLWLVGDHGIYVMSNGHPGDLLVADDPGPCASKHCVYPTECNPATMEFDDWYAVKKEAFGADDGIEFIPLVTAEAMLATGRFVLDLTPGCMEFETCTERLTASAVRALGEACMSLHLGEAPLVVKGIVQAFQFSPATIAEQKDNISALLAELPRQFRADEGGGWSFLQACMRQDGSQWGEHPDMELLFALGEAAGLCRTFPIAPEHLPGGVPYYTILPRGKEQGHGTR